MLPYCGGQRFQDKEIPPNVVIALDFLRIVKTGNMYMSNTRHIPGVWGLGIGTYPGCVGSGDRDISRVCGVWG